jgi:hypothetical protein
MRYYEDLVIGTVTKSERTYDVTREEVIEFAGKYDPQRQRPISAACPHLAGTRRRWPCE